VKSKKIFLVITLSFFCFQHIFPQNNRIVANPMDLNYRFQYEKPAYREAADPVCEYFNGKYYLFASKSGGYWSSPDLAEWTYIPSKTIGTIENYAPTILVYDNAMYYMASGKPERIYRNVNPDKDSWELIDTQFRYPMVGDTDPAFFLDDDGRVYIYWGCSDRDPIIGVEVDPKNGFEVIGEAAVLIEHRSEKYGWEVSGSNNDNNRDGWNEGPCMIKHNGKYYLQYAAPGTEFRVYGDGIYVGDKPLEPFQYVESNPFSFKPGGFIGGAGHGHTFKDKFGNYWHVATMKISVRHMFERRIGLFPLHIDDDGNFIQQSVWTDYPFIIPEKKTDFSQESLSAGWNLLSYNRSVKASSSMPKFPPSCAVDEKVETWWSAATGNVGEWFQVDLRKKTEVRAIQVNFADQDFDIRAPHDLIFYRYLIEASDDGENWTKIVDKSKHTKDAVHELNVLEHSVETRYLRITNNEKLSGKFSLYDFRVFGKDNVTLPEAVANIKAYKPPHDSRKYYICWAPQRGVDGYVVNVFLKNGTYVSSVMVFHNKYRAGFFNRDSEYMFTVDAFNSGGVTKGVEKMEETDMPVLSRNGWKATANPANQPSNAIDGKAETRWDTGRAQEPGQWFTVDTQQPVTFNTIIMDTSLSPGDWPAAYSIHVSDDGINWSDPISAGTQQSSIVIINLPETTARYVRIVQTGSGKTLYWSIHEFYLALFENHEKLPLILLNEVTNIDEKSYPYIANGTFYFSDTEQIPAHATIRIFNTSGQHVQTVSYSGNGISLERLTAGMYIVVFQNGNKIKSWKIVINN